MSMKKSPFRRPTATPAPTPSQPAGDRPLAGGDLLHGRPGDPPGALRDVRAAGRATATSCCCPTCSGAPGPTSRSTSSEVFADEAKRARACSASSWARPTPRGSSTRRRGLPRLAGQAAAGEAGKVGVTGYCMGAGIASCAPRADFPTGSSPPPASTAGAWPPTRPDSPHLLAPKIKAKVYVAGAEEDAGFPPEQADAPARGADRGRGRQRGHHLRRRPARLHHARPAGLQRGRRRTALARAAEAARRDAEGEGGGVGPLSPRGRGRTAD